MAKKKLPEPKRSQADEFEQRLTKLEALVQKLVDQQMCDHGKLGPGLGTRGIYVD